MTAKTPIPKADLEYLEACIQQDHGDYARVDKRALQDVIDEITVRRDSKTSVKKPQSAKTKRQFAQRDRREAATKGQRDVLNMSEPKVQAQPPTWSDPS